MEQQEIIKLPNYVQARTIPYAGFWRRFSAYSVDVLVINSISNWIQALLFRYFMIEAKSYLMIPLIITIIYFTSLTKFNAGQTLGKIIFKIKVVSHTFGDLTWKQVIMRETVGRIIQDTYWILYLIPIFNQYKLSPADWLSETCVIKDDIELVIK